MKHRIFTGLVCSISILALAACGTNEETTSSKGEKVKQEEKKDTRATESSKSVENPREKKEFDEFDLAYQLAIVMKIFQDVTIKYDYAIGNPDYLLRDSMDQKTIDDMKNMLQEQAKNNDKILKDEVNQAYTYLKQSKVSNKDDIQKIIDAQNNYLQIVDKMIVCIDSVTVENAKEKRNEMNNLSKEYLKVAANVTTTVIEVAKNNGVNETEFRSLLLKFLEKPKKQ
ncbi:MULTISPECIES: hypothetical protein [Bacillus]|nr:hypothetical protein [Bacillus wiedmannii]EOP13010.1 hypothetical protein ICS_01174 [Bacillus cereus BAG2O-3]EOQ10081.1 hypothetical protein KQ3_03710 [Bacillus cereus B5-2]MBJ8114681.1 hypothetical protein [Bacillus cereus]PFW83230.1 hypothetical protein COL27_13700 [Bacillus sp. AFS075960]RFB16741.1 hypothetical protein DZB88_07005 [Bacillus sp. OE]RFB24679.1 hypothetical protein DZB85_11835 [Bacillus sp. LB(2018)]RFB50430.1 hypothetical protein DZB83_03665 [Bacillus sp. dmp10]RFB77415